MAIKVLIVDDSQFFCRRVGSVLHAASDIEVIGVANNGREAIEKAQQLKPDVITLDVEMPIMDGVTALKQIVKVCDAKVLMLSSLTYENAKITLDALEAGATDFLLKSYESLSSENTDFTAHLQQRIREIAGARTIKKVVQPAADTKTRADVSKPATGKVSRAKSGSLKDIPSIRNKIKVVAIGASTGGPVALQKVLINLPANFPYPITITQHMPGTFTGAFATRLNSLCNLNILEAQDGMSLEKGNVYVAPGGKQMVFSGTSAVPKVRIRPTDPRLQFSPSVDVTFGSASKVFGGDILAVVLTGMGSDGTEGCRLIKSNGGAIWVQNEATCVVYGMPMSVTKAGLSDIELPIEQFAEALIKQG